MFYTNGNDGQQSLLDLLKKGVVNMNRDRQNQLRRRHYIHTGEIDRSGKH
ncbi:MAG: hypothetical protein WC156_09870 [Pedobacter sp.]